MPGTKNGSPQDQATMMRGIIQQLENKAVKPLITSPESWPDLAIGVASLVHDKTVRLKLLEIIAYAKHLSESSKKPFKPSDCEPIMKALQTIIPYEVTELIHSLKNALISLGWARRGDHEGVSNRGGMDYAEELEKETDFLLHVAAKERGDGV